jgi:hypothetical protein
MSSYSTRKEGLAMRNSSETEETGSGVTGRSGVAYDPEKMGEPGQAGVPMGDQYPSNEKKGEVDDSIRADVHVPGPYPSDQGDPTGEPLSSEPEPTEVTRDAGSLGSLTEDVSTSTMREDTGGLGSPMLDDEKRAD